MPTAVGGSVVVGPSKAGEGINDPHAGAWCFLALLNNFQGHILEGGRPWQKLQNERKLKFRQDWRFV